MLLTAALVGGLVLRWAERDALQVTERTLRAQAALLSEQVSATTEHPALDLSDVRATVRRLADSLGGRFTVIARDGRILADSEEDPARMDNHANRPEVLQAAAEGLGSATRFSHTVGARSMYVAVPVSSGPGVPQVGFVRAAVPLDQVDERLADLRRMVLLGTAVGLLLAIVPGLIFARHVTGPLSIMSEVARSLAQGDYGSRLPIATRDELGSLAEDFNAMARQLRERMEIITSDRNKLLAILASMVEGVVAVDREERIVHMNAVAGRLLGADPEASIGRRMWDVSRLREVSATLGRTLQDSQATATEIKLPGRHRDVILELHGSPLRGADGALSGALMVLHDVTELRRLEAVRRDFVANVSHELKTPLTAIQGVVETLHDDPSMELEQRQRFLEMGKNQANRLASLVRDLLVLSRVEAEDAGISRARIDLRATVQECARNLQHTADEKGLTLEVQVPAEPVWVSGDREYLRQIADNLLSNALMYTPAGGRVTIRLGRKDEPPAEACLEVQDTGIGIAPAFQARIFERFYRVDKARSRHLGGTGLGLAIVKHLVIAHGGDVAVRSTPGQGSTFEVLLPLAPGGEQAP